MTPVRPWLVVRMLAWRELVRFFRQRHRVIGAIGQPLLFWLLFGAGMRQSFRMSSASSPTFLEYYFPGTVMLTLLFTAIFSTISIIEDRREGFLQSVLVSPAGRWAMVLGKLGGGSAIAMLQAFLMLGLGALLDAPAAWFDWLQMVGLLALTALGMTGLGFVLAWRLDSTQGFHAVMNLLLMPMWLLSGAFFPMPAWTNDAPWSQVALHAVMRVNPLTYCVAGTRRAWTGSELPLGYYQPEQAVCWGVAIVFAVALGLLAIRVGNTRTAGDWQ
jgi:ABC-2 type transport system permease protein